mgnify:CR=1 FL=1
MKIMIVDDEPFILRTLKEMIESADENWKVDAICGDGEEAVQRLGEQHFDLVISDIRMPAMDGMELITYINRHFPEIKMILITGFSDIEYAQQAIRCGVVDYLLKPSSFEAVFRSIARVNEMFQKEQNEKRLAQRRLKDVLEKRLDDMLLGLPIPHFDVCLLPHFETMAVLGCSYCGVLTGGWKRATVLAAMKNVAEELLSAYGAAYGVIQENHVAVIVFFKQFQPRTEKEMARSLLKQLERLLKLKFSIGVSKVYDKLDMIHCAYKEAFQSLEMALGTCGNDIVYFQELNHSAMESPDDIMRKLEVKKNRRVISRVLELINEQLSSHTLSLKSIADEVYLNATYLGRIFKEQMGETFSNYLINLRINKAKELLSDPAMKVYEVSEQVGYSDTAYFTKLFKSRVGVTPFEYKSGLEVHIGNR